MLNGSLESCRLTGEVRLGDEKLDQMGLRTRSNHQNLAVRRLQRRNYSDDGEKLSTVGIDLNVIWEMSVD